MPFAPLNITSKCLSSHNDWQKILAAGWNHIEQEYSLLKRGDRLGAIYSNV